jgi:hypothetical protein
MKAAHLSNAVSAAKQKSSFFNKDSRQHFFSDCVDNRPFFPVVQAKSLTTSMAPTLQKKCAHCEEEDKMIQRQEQPGESVTKTDTPDPNTPTAPAPVPRSLRVGKCNSTPEFHNVSCLTQALKLDVDDNLWNNASQFYRVASLYPGDNDMMWNTFLRYGLGVNLLKTSFGFLGASKTLGTALSYGTGIGLKSYEFFKSGKLELNVPIPLGKDIDLNLKLDVNADPNNLTNVKGVNTGIGISGHF